MPQNSQFSRSLGLALARLGPDRSDPTLAAGPSDQHQRILVVAPVQTQMDRPQLRAAQAGAETADAEQQQKQENNR